MPNNIGTLVSAPIRPVNDLDRFPSAYANELLGGYKTAQTLAERDAIPSERRTEGMLCYVIDIKKTYQLVDGITNAHWADFMTPEALNAVENKGGVVSLETGTEAGRPAAGTYGRIYIAYDSKKIYQDLGTEWQMIGGQDAVVKREEFIATAGQQRFILQNGYYEVGKNLLQVYIGGWRQPSSVFEEIDEVTVDITYPLDEGDFVMFEYQEKTSAISNSSSHGMEHTSAGSDPIPNATTARSGLMSAVDKQRLNDMNAGFTHVEQSEINGNIKINGEEKIVYVPQTYVHNQVAASNIWIVNHNLNRFPSVTIVDTAGDVSIGDIRYIDENNIEISFSAEMSGKVFLN